MEGELASAVVLALLGASVPAYLLLQTLVSWRWRGPWRRPGLMPLVVAAPLFAYTAVACATGSNLWPVAMILLSPLLFAWLLLLSLLRWRVSRGGEPGA